MACPIVVACVGSDAVDERESVSFKQGQQALQSVYHLRISGSGWGGKLGKEFMALRGESARE